MLDKMFFKYQKGDLLECNPYKKGPFWIIEITDREFTTIGNDIFPHKYYHGKITFLDYDKNKKRLTPDIKRNSAMFYIKEKQLSNLNLRRINLFGLLRECI